MRVLSNLFKVGDILHFSNENVPEGIECVIESIDYNERLINITPTSFYKGDAFEPTKLISFDYINNNITIDIGYEYTTICIGSLDTIDVKLNGRLLNINDFEIKE